MSKLTLDETKQIKVLMSQIRAFCNILQSIIMVLVIQTTVGKKIVKMIE